ncbi:MAG: Unknown protein [uncultured Sulfurovum sp.]|uniref:Cytochrome c domain-containing protein n=1 Tax=uncultured Sulfurovum sp. TaxID=269237 RepID=A0A6S6SQ50_9BACT|nr:MAG: Unknown protein [uncultured Sulfurovum sp.]
MNVHNKLFLIGYGLTLSLALVGCGGGSSSTSTPSDSTNTPTPTLPIEYKADAGRLLGSQCAQCHGTNGVSVNSWDSIAGESDLADEIFDDEPIMTAQAHGYTSEEITLIGNWLKTLTHNEND